MRLEDAFAPNSQKSIFQNAQRRVFPASPANFVIRAMMSFSPSSTSTLKADGSFRLFGVNLQKHELRTRSSTIPREDESFSHL